MGLRRWCAGSGIGCGYGGVEGVGEGAGGRGGKGSEVSGRIPSATALKLGSNQHPHRCSAIGGNGEVEGERGKRMREREHPSVSYTCN